MHLMAHRSWSFVVPGPPRGKGRPRFGQGRTFTDKKTVAYERTVKQAALESGGELIDGPVAISVEAFMPRPKSRPSSVTKADWKSGEALPHVARPDADNLLKVVCDALNGVAYRDDAQVWWTLVRKRYAAEGEPARVDVRITEAREG